MYISKWYKKGIKRIDMDLVNWLVSLFQQALSELSVPN